MPYNAPHTTSIHTLEDLRKHLENELRELEKSFAETTEIELRPIYAEPARPREGMIVYADGTSWNPGAGKGVYVYTGAAWSKL